MKKEDISLQIKNNFDNTGWKIDDLRVQPDPFIGWQIVIVSRDFEGKTRKERKEKALAGLDTLQIEWLELLTPEEKEWAGALPAEVDVENLPLWPEALARGKLFDPEKEKIRFLSDMDDDIEPPIIATFYSLRGGVGRSTALGYTAHILASQGRKVVCVDMDLEAPGITALFNKEKEIKEGMGLVHLLMEIDQGGTPDVTKHLVRVSDSYDLYCLPAGKPDANYARILRFIDPESWYREDRNPLHELMDRLGKNLPFTPDVILLDARTGITQLSGPLLFDLSDISIIVFFPHPQAKTGTEVLVKALLAAKTRREINGLAFSPEIRFLVSPIPLSKAAGVERRYKQRAVEWVSEWISPWKNLSSTGGEILESDITHFVPYREIIATSDEIMPEDEIWRDYKPVADWIDGFITIPGEKNISINLGDRKDEILENFSFSTGTAEHQTDFLDTFVETDLVKKALSPEIILVLGRKGTGKTAIFRRILAEKDRDVFIVTSPVELSSQHPFFLPVNGFKTIEETLQKSNAGWSEFWIIYICLISYYALIKKKGDAPKLPGEENIPGLLTVKPSNPMEVDDFIAKFMKINRYRLIADEWLTKLDRYAGENTVFLFDGLDTGFGIGDTDRERRKKAIEGLFSVVTDSGSRLKNLKFKIMLREDIWKSLKFENKSHLFGRSIPLKWADQVTFFKVLIKQAIRNNNYKELLENSNLPISMPIEYWAEPQVIEAWNRLVGDRMKGSKSAFTRNWVWNRLADGNEDHSPRYLLLFMHQAVEWEKNEQKRNPNDKSIIRPRAFTTVLPDVSKQALGALRDEEFQELKPLMENLTEIGRAPVNASDIKVLPDLINLAREVGLLGVYEGSEEEVERYSVPELFRHALKMTRKGQM